MTNINRREVIYRLSAILGVAFTEPLAAGAMGQKTYFGPSVEYSPQQEALIAEIADVIIPATSTPGAKEAGAEKFIVRVVRDCFEKNEQDEFYAGLDGVEKRSSAKFGKSFAALSPGQKIQIIRDTEADDKKFFGQIKGLVVTGYFTSEIGATQALDYLPVPGRFEGSYPLKPEQKTWAL